MPTRPRAYDFGDDPLDSSYDRTLRALEGRVDQDFLLSATSGSGRRDTLDGDDTGDVFLKIAREESSRRRPDENLPDETQSVVVSHIPLASGFCFFRCVSAPCMSRDADL